MSEIVAQLIAKGKFAIYKTPKEGIHLTLQFDGDEEPKHIELPAFMVKMMMKKAAKENGFGAAEIPSDFTTLFDGDSNG